MKKNKIVLLIILMLSIICFLSGCEKKIYESDYFTYQIMKRGEIGKYVAIYGLTELGKEQEILIIPEYIDGLPVLDMGVEYGVVGTFYKGSFESETLNRVYILFDPINHNTLNRHMFEKCSNIEKVVYLKFHPIQGPNYNAKSFFRSDFIEEENFFLMKDNILPANVSYMYNFDGAPNNGHYWVDDYDNELISYLPDDPIREGYTFLGWYKDKECTNIWDFGKDIVPQKSTEYNSYFDTESYIYKETILYAKWENNNN